MKTENLGWLATKAGKVTGISVAAIALIMAVTFINGGPKDTKQLVQNTALNTGKAINVATGAEAATANTGVQTPLAVRVSAPSNDAALVQALKDSSAAIKALTMKDQDEESMNDAAKGFKDAVVSDKLSITEIAFLKKTNNPLLVEAALVGAGTDKAFFMPKMGGLVEPMIDMIQNNSQVALSAFDTADKNKAATLTLADIQLAKDKRWTPEERAIINVIGYDTKTGLFLTKAAEAEAKDLADFKAGLKNDFGSVQSRIASVAGNLNSYKANMKNRLRDGAFEGQGSDTTWTVGFRSEKVWQ